jgi:hypothetical protein
MSRTSAAAQGELIYRVKAEVKLWASQLRISGKAEVRILLAEVDSIKRDLTHVEAACFDLQKQVKGLQDSRRDMLAQIDDMVPRLELENSQAKTVMLLDAVERLQSDAETFQQEKTNLVSTMQVLLTMVFFDIEGVARSTRLL